MVGDRLKSRYRVFLFKGKALAKVGGNFSAFWLSTMQHHTNTFNAISYSMLNADYNGAVFMNG